MSSLQKYENLDIYKSAIFFDQGVGQFLCTSRYVAEKFDKRHDNVLRSINELVEKLGGSKESGVRIGHLIFEVATYTDEQWKPRPEYRLSMNAFILLAKGFEGDEATQVMITFLGHFNKMAEEMARMTQAATQKLIAEKDATIEKLKKGPRKFARGCFIHKETGHHYPARINPDNYTEDQLVVMGRYASNLQADAVLYNNRQWFTKYLPADYEQYLPVVDIPLNAHGIPGRTPTEEEMLMEEVPELPEKAKIKAEPRKRFSSCL